MNWREFFVALLGAVAWPAVVVTAVLVLRAHLGRLVDRIKTASGAGMTLELERAMGATADANAALGSIESPPPGGESAELVPEPEPEERPTAAPGPDQTDGGTNSDIQASDPARYPARVAAPGRVSLSYDELELIATEFAQAGWTLRDTGAQTSPPVPLRSWREGRPRIEGWAGGSPGDAPGLGDPVLAHRASVLKAMVDGLRRKRTALLESRDETLVTLAQLGGLEKDIANVEAELKRVRNANAHPNR